MEVENMETTIKPTQIEVKQSKKNLPYWHVQTTDGLMSTFDKDCAEAVTLAIKEQRTLNVNMTVKDQFKNIKCVAKNASFDKAIAKNVVSNNEDVVSNKFVEAREEKNKAIYASYAKDIFIAMSALEQFKHMDIVAMMDISIAMVKKAAKEF
jgi:hypothetical protein